MRSNQEKSLRKSSLLIELAVPALLLAALVMAFDYLGRFAPESAMSADSCLVVGSEIVVGMILKYGVIL